jgi:hypothetical protein
MAAQERLLFISKVAAGAAERTVHKSFKVATIDLSQTSDHQIDILFTT